MGQTKNCRLPAERCAICDKALEDVGGRRIVRRGQHLFVGVCDSRQNYGDPDFGFQNIPLNDAGAPYLALQGPKGMWNDESIKNAQQNAVSGYRPWICQGCAGLCCSDCGAPQNIPVRSSILNDEGSVSGDAPYFAGYAGCCNPLCIHYRPSPILKPKRIRSALEGRYDLSLDEGFELEEWMGGLASIGLYAMNEGDVLQAPNERRHSVHCLSSKKNQRRYAKEYQIRLGPSHLGKDRIANLSVDFEIYGSGQDAEPETEVEIIHSMFYWDWDGNDNPHRNLDFGDMLSMFSDLARSINH